MPLIVEGEVFDSPLESVKDLLKRHPKLQVEAKAFCEKPVTAVDAVGLLYVNQREFAVVTPEDKSIHTLGSEDATTCHVVVIQHTGSGVCCLAHCDGSDTLAEVNAMIKDLQRHVVGAPEGMWNVYLAGGFLDNRSSSSELSLELIGALMSQEIELNLNLACITDFNDVVKEDTHFPAVMGLAIDVRSGDVFPATFPNKGPDMALRSAIHFVGGKFCNVYDPSQECLVVGPYEWDPWNGVETWLNAPDYFIENGHVVLVSEVSEDRSLALQWQHLSTSPEQEPPYFEAHVKAALRVIYEHPNPSITLFPGGEARYYEKKPSGEWEQIEKPG